MNREQALERIRKCLAMSSSPNATEAATALRQAHSLMRKFDIDEGVAGLPKIEGLWIEAEGSNPQTWEILLTSTIAAALGIEVMKKVYATRQKSAFLYHGRSERVKLAEYAHHALRNAIVKARKHFVNLKSFELRYTTPQLRQMGQSFANAYVIQVYQSVQDLVEKPTEEETKAINEWVAANVVINENAKEPKLKIPKIHREAAAAGYRAGQDFKLHKPLT